MYVIDVNTSFGKRVAVDPRFSVDVLVGLRDEHDVAGALSFTQRGVAYDMHAGNAETFAAAARHRQLLPVGVIDPRDALGVESALGRCLTEGVRAMRGRAGDESV